ncbi:MAG: methyltransferase domain-containing protein [Vulcanimicrobiota bacterium]
MDSLATATFLISAPAAPALDWLTPLSFSPADVPRLLAALRKDYSSEESLALLSLAQQRRKASGRIDQAEQLFFIDQADEQASSSLAARRRAEKLHRLAPSGPILELGCGIGADTIELARLRPVIAFEKDEARLLLARTNCQRLGLQVDFRLGDWLSQELPAAAAAYLDPSRRHDGRRRLRPDDWDPPLGQALARLKSLPTVVKAAPGIRDGELPANCQVEFVGFDRTCPEAVLWCGFGLTGRLASLHTESGWLEIEGDLDPAPTGGLEGMSFLFEPQPALVRARALTGLCQSLDAHLVDAEIAYLVGPRQVEGELFSTFFIEAVLPAREKILRAEIRQRQIGQLEIKKRGVELDPDQFRKRLKPSGPNRGVLLLFRKGRGRLAVLARRAGKMTDSPKGPA